MFINSLQRGGAETQFLRVARALAAAGFEVEIYTLLADNGFTAETAQFPVQLLAERPGPATLVAAIRSMRARRPDVVVSFLYQATVVARIAARASGVRAVVSSMRNERLENRLRTVVYRATGVLDTVTVTNSHAAARVLVEEGTVPAHRLRVIPNGVDLRLFDAPGAPTLRAELRLPAATVLFLGMGRLVAQKDWPTLLRAVAAYDGPAAHWAIAGDGPDAPALRALIEQLGVGDRVTLLGLRGDAPRLLAACDALVLSSTYEGLPNVVLEAMAAGRPVVATRVGGCAELLGTAFGLLVPPGRPAELATALAELAGRDPAQRSAIGASAARHIRENYSLAAADERWVALVGEVLHPRR